MTHLSVKRFVACPFSAAVELAERAANRVSSLYLSPFPPLGERATFAVASIPDSTDETRKHDALLIAWRPQTRRMFPNFHGVITVRPESSGVMLQLSGAYNPPYAIAGKAFDLLAGRSIAKRTMVHLLDELAAGIQTEYTAEKRDRQMA